MPIRLPSASRNAACDAVVDRLDLGSGAAVLEIRSGAQPATANDAASGTLLATFTLADPAFGSAGSGSAGSAALAGTPRTAVGGADGVAGWCRALDSDGATVLDGSVSVTGGGGDFQLNTTAVSVGVNLEISAGAMVMPAG